MALNITTYAKLDMSSAQKALDSFIKQKPKLNIDVNIDGFDDFQNKLKNFQAAVNQIVAERKKLDEAIGSGSLTVKQVEALSLIEQAEKELASQRKQMLKEFASLQEQITQVRLEALERIKAKEQENATKAEEAIARQAAAFERMYGSLQEGVILPAANGGMDEITSAIRAMDGFASANIKATGSVQAGDIALDRYIVTLNNAGGGYNQYRVSVDQATGATYLLEQGLVSTNIATDSTANAIDALANALAAVGANKAIGEIRDVLWGCVEATISLQSALAGVRKTTSFTVEEMGFFKDQILELSGIVPETAVNIAKIVETAGQMNIAKEHIIPFTKTMSDLAVSTNLAGDAAAMSLSKFANITNMPQDQFSNLGSSIAVLGNNLSTVESAIVDMALRLASAGSVAKMTEAEIMGIAGALSALGMESQLGGSAISKTINRITIAVETANDELNDFARVANMSAQSFSQAWRTDAANALSQFIVGLSDADRLGANTIVLLDELNLREVRQSDALRRLAGNSELLTNSIRMSSEAWEENIALSEEAQIRYETTASKTQLMDNAIFQLQSAIGDELRPALDGLLDSGTSITMWAVDMIKDNTMLVAAFTSLTTAIGVATGTIAAAAAGKAILATATKALGLSLAGGTLSLKAFTAALMATPIAPVALALGTLAAAITAVTIVTSQSSAAQIQARQSAIESANAASQLGDNLITLVGVYNNLSDAINLDEAAKSTLLQTQNELLKTLGLENESIDSLAEKYGSLTEAIRATSVEKLKGAEIDITSGFSAAREGLLAASSSGLIASNNIISASGNEAVKAFKTLEAATIVQGGAYGNDGGALVLTGNQKTIEGALENYNKLKQALETLQDAFTPIELANNELYQNIYDRYNELSPAVEAYNNSLLI